MQALSIPWSRRQFIRVSAVCTALIAAVARLPKALAAAAIRSESSFRGRTPRTLFARTYDLAVDRRVVRIGDRFGSGVLVNGTLPAPTLRFREGEDVTIHVTNRMAEDTSIHWHGLLVPANMDGVPALSFPGIRAGETFTYQFRPKQSGTYWYHSHSGGQEQEGMYGAIVIDPATKDPQPYDREHVILLSDWSSEEPGQILGNLKKDPSWYNYQRRTVPQFFREWFQGRTAAERRAVVQDRLMWGKMRMDPTDISDVTGSAYRFLINGKPPEANWTALFRAGERVRLRFINGAAMTFFDVRIPGLTMTVIQADGQDIATVAVDEIRLGVAETYDVIVEPKAGVAYTIFAQAMDRSGYARATIAEREGASAPIPTMDARTLRSMNMEAMGMSGMDMAGMDMPGMAMPKPPAAGDPKSALDQPGRRKLAYTDLRALTPNLDIRAPEATIGLHLTGDMWRYFWTIDGLKLSDAPPIRMRKGQRVRLQMTNDTMMDHPMHLHGVFVELQNGQPAEFAPRKHTIIVPPFETVTADLTAIEPGTWAFHCHLLYHMMTGMFIKVIIDPEEALTDATDGPSSLSTSIGQGR